MAGAVLLVGSVVLAFAGAPSELWVLLLVSAVLMIRTFLAMRNVDPGFSDPASLQIMRLTIPETLVRSSTTTLHMQNSILDKLAAIPGVSSVGFAASVPMSGA